MMRELIQKIKTYTEAGIILNHMELFDEAFSVQLEQHYEGVELRNELISIEANTSENLRAEIRLYRKRLGMKP